MRGTRKKKKCLFIYAIPITASMFCKAPVKYASWLKTKPLRRRIVRYFFSKPGFQPDITFPEKIADWIYFKPTDNQTRCPNKGKASSYWSIVVADKVLDNCVWSYPEPLPENVKIKNCLCYFNERVDAIYVNGEVIPKPVTPWSL